MTAGSGFEIPKPMIISYSEVFKWDTCQRQYYYRFVKGLKPLEESAAITTGVKGHKLLQNFYTFLQEGKTKEEAHILTQKSAQNLLTSDGFVDGGLLKSWTLVDNYIRTTEFKTEAVEVETRFLFPAALLSDAPELAQVQIGFTPDVVFKRQGEFHDIEDYKFVARAWSKSKLNRFQQAKLYQVFMRRMGYKVSRTSVRFFNVTTARIHVQNYTLEPKEEQILINDFVDGIREVIKYRRSTEENLAKARRTMNYTACQYCAFEFPCTLEAEGKDATKTFQYQFKKSDYDYNR